MIGSQALIAFHDHPGSAFRMFKVVLFHQVKIREQTQQLVNIPEFSVSLNVTPFPLFKCFRSGISKLGDKLYLEIFHF